MSGEPGGGEGAAAVVEAPVKVVEKSPIVPLRSNPESSLIEKTEDQRFLEDSRNFGRYYRSFIGEIAGRGSEDRGSFESLPLELKAEAAIMTTSVRRQFIEQALRFADNKMDARSLLGQVYKGPEYDELLADPSKYRLEQLSDGVYVVHVDVDLMAKLKGSKQVQAVAVLSPGTEGVNFLIVRDIPGNQEQAKLEENIPHEIEHIAWRFIQRDGLAKTTETDPVLAQGFRNYQDELLARVSSEGAIGGASYLNLVPKAQRERIFQEHPESVQQLTEVIYKFGGIIETFRDEFSGSTLNKSDLILTVIRSRSFAELEAGIEKMRFIASQNPRSNVESQVVGESLKIAA